MDDRTAISRIKQGGLDSLEHLVRCYQGRAVHAAYLILYDRAQAEDVAQAAFVKAVDRIHQFDADRPFAPWFFRIVVNDALKLARTRKRFIPLEEPDETVSHLAAWLADPTPQPEQRLEEKQIREHLLEAVASLPPDLRAVIVMRYFLDMSEADMAEETGRPVSTIKWWLRDARKRLTSLIQVLR